MTTRRRTMALALVRSIRENLLLNKASRPPRPICVWLPYDFDLEEEEEDDDLETLRAIQHYRFSHYHSCTSSGSETNTKTEAIFFEIDLMKNLICLLLVDALKKNRACQKFIRRKMITIQANIEENKNLKDCDWAKEDLQLKAAVSTFGINWWRKTLNPDRVIGQEWVDGLSMRINASCWNKIAQFIPGHTRSQCNEDIDLWECRPEEDSKLLVSVNEFGPCWSKIAGVKIPHCTDNMCLSGARKRKQSIADTNQVVQKKMRGVIVETVGCSISVYNEVAMKRKTGSPSVGVEGTAKKRTRGSLSGNEGEVNKRMRGSISGVQKVERNIESSKFKSGELVFNEDKRLMVAVKLFGSGSWNNSLLSSFLVAQSQCSERSRSKKQSDENLAVSDDVNYSCGVRKRKRSITDKLKLQKRKRWGLSLGLSLPQLVKARPRRGGALSLSCKEGEVNETMRGSFSRNEPKRTQQQKEWLMRPFELELQTMASEERDADMGNANNWRRKSTPRYAKCP
uniref:Myb-like domain-containing protein n=1 Tax=Oryza punctata TaxID=4537 RepID=A0A0E0LGQ2_ORYPU